jgi:ABC-2 type transport system permease protein
MRNALLVANRELGAYLRSPLGYVVAAASLLIDGILYYAFVLGAGQQRLSAEVLMNFFYYASGTTMIAAIALSIRLLAGEREIVAGKFLSALAFLGGMTLLTLYMPALIFVNGKVSVGHVAVGYLGLLLLASAALSIGLFASALARTQVIAAILGAALLATMVLLWAAAKVTDPPVSGFVSGLAIHHEHFKPFMTGVLKLENVVYYVGVSYFFLLCAVKTLEARRWR